MIENKEVMARNIKRLMDDYHVKAVDICKALGFKQNTFSDWVRAETYPRIDAIEKLANYFHVSKADLVENYDSRSKETRHIEVVESDIELLVNEYKQLDTLGKHIVLETAHKELDRCQEELRNQVSELISKRDLSYDSHKFDECGQIPTDLD